MIAFEGLEENFRFLVLEVTSQVRATFQLLEKPSQALYDKIVSRDDYIDNLKNIIENNCFSKIHTEQAASKNEINRIRALQTMAINLERIADFSVNIVQQLGHLSDPGFLKRFHYAPMFEQIFKGMDLVQPARNGRDLAGALSICRAENELDRLYKENFDRIMAMLRTGLNVENLITVLFIIRYLERIGDSLLNIGEALIFAAIGEKIKIEQFQALQTTLGKSGFSGALSEIDFQSIWGTRSGCRISRLDSKSRAQALAQGGIFKEGALRKIRREKENIESWELIYPGLGPKVFSYHEDGDKASILVQFLPGCTLDEIILGAEPPALDTAFSIFEQTLIEIWRASIMPGPAPTDYVQQTRKRIPAVLQVHPDFVRPQRHVSGASVLSTEELLAACEAAEQELPAPYTVFIHGDFNANNVVYDQRTERIHFIDLHRSMRADFVQDISVFLISNFRLPVFDAALRARLDRTIRTFLGFAREFAGEQNDATFEARLALALARSLYTSTRFELHPAFAKEMFLRSHFLLEQVARHRGKPWEAFRLPETVLYA